MGDDDVRLDRTRPDRVGFEEAILCAGKTVDQLAAILDRLTGTGALLTRLDPATLDRLPDEQRRRVDYCAISRTGFYDRVPSEPEPPAVAVVAAGSSDLPQVTEVVRTLTYFGVATETVVDVGVAGLWRLLENVERLREFAVVVTVAGMDGALPSVLGGLVPGSIICLPTSTGYGAARGGETALHAALTSCAPGLVVVNIDNGYGAACAAYRTVRMLRRR